MSKILIVLFSLFFFLFLFNKVNENKKETKRIVEQIDPDYDKKVGR